MKNALALATVNYNYGVKSEKAKARKSRKARRAEGRHHGHKGLNVNDYSDSYGKMTAVRKSNKHGRNLLLSQWETAECAIEEEYDLHGFCVRTRAEVHEEEVRLANMTDEEKAEKRRILMEHLAKISLQMIHSSSDIETERGTFYFSQDGEFWDEWDSATWHTEAVYLKKYNPKKDNWEVVYTIWDETLKPRPVDVMIEDMVKII